MDVLGYWESWNDVEYSNSEYPPDACNGGCVQPENFITKTKAFTTINNVFILLSNNWYSGYDPDGGCQAYNKCGGAACPFCDDDKNKWPHTSKYDLYWIAQCRGSKYYSPFINSDTSAQNPTVSVIRTREIGRLAHQHPDGPKAFHLAFGGWTDCAILPESDDDINKLADIITKCVYLCFADGVDFDFEHFTQLSSSDQYRTPEQRSKIIASFSKLITSVRSAFDKITSWDSIIKDVNNWLDDSYNKKQIGDKYYNSNKIYLQDLCRLKPKFSISYTPRFNAFISDSSTLFPGFQSFKTDGEGLDLFKYQTAADTIDTINLMIYDVKFPVDYKTAYTTIIEQTGPKDKLLVGIEPGKQAGAPDAPPITNDEILEVADLVKQYNLKGLFFWSINDPVNYPSSSIVQQCNEKLGAHNNIYKDGDFTKCNATNGWIDKTCSAATPLSLSSSNNTTPTNESKNPDMTLVIVYTILTVICFVGFVVSLVVLKQNWIIPVILEILFVLFIVIAYISIQLSPPPSSYHDIITTTIPPTLLQNTSVCVLKADCESQCIHPTCDYICK